MIRALVFDCFGVLYQGSRTYLFDRTPAALHDELRNLNTASDYGYIAYDAYIQQAAEMTGIDEGALEHIFATEHQRNERLVELVRQYRAQSYKIGLLSNVGTHVMERLFSPDEQTELFDAVVLSSDVAAVKPHPQMYEVVIEKLAVQPDECIMIDDIQANVDGARAVGMYGVQFMTTTQVEQDVRRQIEAVHA